MISEGITATIVSGVIGIGAVLANKFKCILEDGDKYSCRCGCVEGSIVDSNEIEVKSTRINGTDFLYVSKRHIDVNSDNDTDDDTDDDNDVDDDSLD